MVSSAEVARLRSAQQGLSALVERDLAAFFASLNLDRPEAVRDALLEFVPLLVEQYGDAAAAVAADWYDEVRAAEGVRGRFRAQPAPGVELVRVESRVRSAAGHLWTSAPGETLAALAGSVQKYVLAPGRQTIVDSTHRDPQAQGWQRVTRPGGCDFCRMLAGRGGVYREATARFAAHGHCNCAAVPSWDPDAPEVDVMAYVASERTSNMTPEQREAHTARVRDWIAANLDS